MNVKQIKEIVENYTQIDISKKTHKWQYSEARFIFVYCVREYADEYMSETDLGRILNQHYATVLASYDRFYQLYETEPRFKRLADKIRYACEQVIETEPITRSSILPKEVLKLRTRLLAVLENNTKLQGKYQRLRKKHNKICNYELIN